MELIRKKILQAVTTGTTTGCTGTCFVIIPNTGATYCFNICLTQEVFDIGFFNAYVEVPYGYGYFVQDNFTEIPIGYENLLI